MLSMIYGLMGKGKSHFGLFYALCLCEKYQKRLVTNFFLNLDVVAYYCHWMGYDWFLSQLDKGGIVYLSLDGNASQLLSIPGSVVLCDEAALYFPARNSRDTPQRLLADIVQMRKDKSYLICICQAEFQIDRQIRGLQFEVFHANGIVVFDKKLRSERLIYKSVLRFDPERYNQYISDPKIRKNPLKSRILANKRYAGFLKACDKFIFNCFDSFARLDHRDADFADDYEKVIYLSQSWSLKFEPTDDFYLASEGKLPSLPKLNKISKFFFFKTGLLELAIKFSKVRFNSFEKLILRRAYFFFWDFTWLGGSYV